METESHHSIWASRQTLPCLPFLGQVPIVQRKYTSSILQAVLCRWAGSRISDVSAVASSAYHSMGKYNMASELRHDRATLQTSQSRILCYTAGLKPGIVSNSSSAFQVLSFRPRPYRLFRCCFLRVHCMPRAHPQVPCEHMDIMLRFETKTLLMSRTSFDGTGISIHIFWFLHLIIASILSLHPNRSCATFVQSVPTHCATACSHLHTLNLRPWHREPNSFFKFRSHSISFRLNIRLVSRCGSAVVSRATWPHHER